MALPTDKQNEGESTDCEDMYQSILKAIVDGNLDIVFDSAQSLWKDVTRPMLERLKSGLIAARFGYYHGQAPPKCKMVFRDQAEEICKSLKEMLDKFGIFRYPKFFFLHFMCRPS